MTKPAARLPGSVTAHIDDDLIQVEFLEIKAERLFEQRVYEREFPNLAAKVKFPWWSWASRPPCFSFLLLLRREGANLTCYQEKQKSSHPRIDRLYSLIPHDEQLQARCNSLAGRFYWCSRLYSCPILTG